MDELSPAQIQNLKAKLLKNKDALLAIKDTADQASETVELDQTKMGRLSRIDALQGQAMSKETQRRQNIHLLQIEKALKRIETGDYGYCRNCDELINYQRLEVNPAADYCINCAD